MCAQACQATQRRVGKGAITNDALATSTVQRRAHASADNSRRTENAWARRGAVKPAQTA
jgi:hypothetical protein